MRKRKMAPIKLTVIASSDPGIGEIRVGDTITFAEGLLKPVPRWQIILWKLRRLIDI